MSHRTKKTQMKPITAYMEAEGSQSDVVSEVQQDTDHLGLTTTLVDTIRNTMTQ